MKRLKLIVKNVRGLRWRLHKNDYWNERNELRKKLKVAGRESKSVFHYYSPELKTMFVNEVENVEKPTLIFFYPFSMN